VPLIVRILDGNAGYELIAGHRRLRAARIAGQTALPRILRCYTDEEARTARMLENLLRENLEPLEEAEGYRQMNAAAEAEQRPVTPEELAAKLGKRESYIRLRLRLLTADPAVQ
jgi:ParB family chromosome partitioning protein